MSASDVQPPNGTSPTGARHVFVSFASEDLDLARGVVDRLEQSGFRCWISDRDIAPAASYPAAITAALAGSAAVVLLLTESANASPHVVREVELAFTARTPILPVRISGVLPSSDLQYFLSTTQWFDAGKSVDEADYSKVESRLRELLERTPGIGGAIDTRRPWRIAAIAGVILTVAAVAALVLRPNRPTDLASSAPSAPGLSTGPAPAVTPGGAAETTAVSSDATFKVNPRDGQTYAWIPPGRFVMGCSQGDPDCSDDEMPPHAVRVAGFWLARTEVTIARYRKTGTAPAGSASSADQEAPLTGVSWPAAKSYCASVGGRLPTEAEWEYAARAGTTARYYDAPATVAWFADNTDGQPMRVGTKAANAFGLHDMLGNVSEWVLDRYYNRYDDSSEASEIEEPLAPNASGVARGGSWVSDAEGVRVSRRLDMFPDAEEPHIGFRCAIDRL